MKARRASSASRARHKPYGSHALRETVLVSPTPAIATLLVAIGSCSVALAATEPKALPASTRPRATPAKDERSTDDAPFSFVVLGHPKGAVDGVSDAQLPEAIERIARLAPDFVVITGDCIHGDYYLPPPTEDKKVADEQVIVPDWERFDASLRPLDMPIYRVPGNHDVHCLVSRRVWRSRYGDVPRAFTFGNSLFLLLDSVGFQRVDNAPATRTAYDRWSLGTQLDSAQLAFIEKQLAGAAGRRHVFLFMHHVLWRNPAAAWWTKVHPLLRSYGRVRAVFAGDISGGKFSHTAVDGIHYIQNTMLDAPPATDPLGGNADLRMRIQMDHLGHVRIDGDSVRFDFHALGALDTDVLDLAYWKTVDRGVRRSLLARVQAVLEDRWRFVAGFGPVLVIGFGAGWAVSRRRQRRTEQAK